MKKRVLFDEVMISRMITRIANEIIEQNKLEAIKWYEKATKQGHVGAQFRLGYAYFEGTNLQQNYKNFCHLIHLLHLS